MQKREQTSQGYVKFSENFQPYRFLDVSASCFNYFILNF